MGRRRILPPLVTAALLVACLVLDRGAVGTALARRQKEPAPWELGAETLAEDEAGLRHGRTKYEPIGGKTKWAKGRTDSEARRDLRNGFSAQKSRSHGGDDRPLAAGILGTLSLQGLDYVKEVLVGEILEEITPLQMSDISSQVISPIGRVDSLVSNITLTGADVFYSEFDLGDTGIMIYAVGITAALTLNWEYHYTASYVPWPVGDSGRAEIKVNGMQAGVSFKLVENNGTLRLVVDEAGTYIENLEIVLDGGASWLYQWFVYAFDYKIRATIEDQLTLQMIYGAEGLDEWLLHLPRAIPIDETSALDVTVVQDPLLSPSYLSVGAKGEFVAASTPPAGYPEPDTQLPAGLFCDQSLKMVTIAFSDYVLNSAAFVYYESGDLVWDVDSVPGKKYMNTANWKYVIPQLYKKYPNEDMIISFAVSSAPSMDITAAGIKAGAGADMTIEVKDGDEVVPVACINVMVSFDGVANLIDTNLTGEATLDDLSISVKWSDVGNFHTTLLQVAIRTIMKDFVLPLINMSLKQGFPIPTVAGVHIEDADLRYGDGYLLVCANVRYEGGFFNRQREQQMKIPELYERR